MAPPSHGPRRRARGGAAAASISVAVAPLLLLAALAPGQAAGQFNFHVDPGRIAQSLEESSHKVAEALHTREAGSAVATVLAKADRGIVNTAAAVVAGQAAAAATDLPIRPESALAALAPTGDMPSPGGLGNVPPGSENGTAATQARGGPAPSPHDEVADAWKSIGNSLKKAAQATGIEDQLKNTNPHELATAVEGALSKNVADIMRDDQLKQELQRALERSNPQLADALKHADPQQVEAALKGTDPRDIEEVLVALEHYHWWRTHWHWFAFAIFGPIITGIVLLTVVRRFRRPTRRSQQQTLLMDAEINMWVRAGTRLAEKPSEEESPVASFQQF